MDVSELEKNAESIISRNRMPNNSDNEISSNEANASVKASAYCQSKESEGSSIE